MDQVAVEERLATRARETADAAQRALQWFNDEANAGSVGQEQRALNREFRRFALAARKLEQAVARPMCVGVFGPSQAGKSYLVGDKPSIADAYLYVVLRWAHGKSVDLTGLDNLAAFFKRMEADKGVQAALQAEGLQTA